MEHLIDLAVFVAKAFVVSVLTVATMSAIHRNVSPPPPPPPPFGRN